MESAATGYNSSLKAFSLSNFACKTPFHTSAQVVSCFVRLWVEPVFCLQLRFIPFYFLRMKLKMEVSQALDSYIFATLNKQTHKGTHANLYVCISVFVSFIHAEIVHQ